MAESPSGPATEIRSSLWADRGTAPAGRPARATKRDGRRLRAWCGAAEQKCGRAGIARPLGGRGDEVDGASAPGSGGSSSVSAHASGDDAGLTEAGSWTCMSAEVRSAPQRPARDPARWQGVCGAAVCRRPSPARNSRRTRRVRAGTPSRGRRRRRDSSRRRRRHQDDQERPHTKRAPASVGASRAGGWGFSSSEAVVIRRRLVRPAVGLKDGFRRVQIKAA